MRKCLIGLAMVLVFFGFMAVVAQGCDLMAAPSTISFFAGLVVVGLGLTMCALGLRYLARLFVVFAALWLAACGTTVQPGYVGIKVNKWGANRGVSDYTVTTGWVPYNPFTTSIFEYPTFVQTAVWTKSTTEGKPVNEEISFTTLDQMSVNADISLAYHLVGEKVPAFYVKFRSDDLDHFTHGFLRNLAREKFDNNAGRYKIEAIMGDNAQFLKEVRDNLQGELTPIGVELDQFGFIGAPRPPETVIAAINAKVQATQNAIAAENQVRQAKAQAESRVAAAEGDARARIATAEGEAKANEVLTRSLSAQLLEWKRLEIQQRATDRWKGDLPQYMGGGAVPFIQIGPKQ